VYVRVRRYPVSKFTQTPHLHLQFIHFVHVTWTCTYTSYTSLLHFTYNSLLHFNSTSQTHNSISSGVRPRPEFALTQHTEQR
jgi:hypothetical protein